eukprot:TRINITY_DN12106_c3_g1_i1.p1 TRINITY_DN12106_c3_g1~~TRINITY_DN12106_c3_g1_i1.p1  ORF type:complete len:366 (-),score=15.78 TRINITY_DN12106_c3_g1_i1:43-1140(-)
MIFSCRQLLKYPFQTQFSLVYKFTQNSCHVNSMVCQLNWLKAYVQVAQYFQHEDNPNLVKPCKGDCLTPAHLTWCSFKVQIPDTKWSFVCAPVDSLKFVSKFEDDQHVIHMSQGLRIIQAWKEEQVVKALLELRESMQDRVIGIDLEWVAFQGLDRRVSLIQLASSSVCVLIRCCRMDFRLPQALKDFLQDPKITLVGFDWDNTDERKMKWSFNMSRQDFGHYVDLKDVSEGLGYAGYGLAGVCHRILGLMPLKNEQLSNWEAKELTMQQIHYAAIDAFLTGQIFRVLRKWHAERDQGDCEICQRQIGEWLPNMKYLCLTESCKKQFNSIVKLWKHCKQYSHPMALDLCPKCGRVRNVVTKKLIQ